ncbi:4'-phosphopantetheinyl transferase family protein [Vreelandella massiliensis]|uniref:4'-phosphopantetheinyl transferase family protein n=1 Tax=Vreelandella massiliensis TaxID=1816686 RepID=UPI00096A56F8|nr:4'-phosphopantetheinyl transferase superfamily protein [Halomonas massiliensis]
MPHHQPSVAPPRIWLLPIASAVPRTWYDYLDAQERARADRFLNPADRSAFIAAHVMLRALLSSCGTRAPSDWTFTVDANGKPRIADDNARSFPSFNISHTAGLVAAIADPAGRAVGIDVEPSHRVIDPIMTPWVLSGEERKHFTRLDETAAGDELLQRWVLKEALAKATGQGLAMDVTRIEIIRLFPPAVFFEPDEVLGHADTWHLENWRAEGRHQVAVAVQCVQGSSPTLTKRMLSEDALSHLLHSYS